MSKVLIGAVALAQVLFCGCITTGESGGSVVSPTNISTQVQSDGRPVLPPLDPWYYDYNIPIPNWEDEN